ncbi:MAG TPA: hypothetical protein VK194_12030 [Candidatus Deferrimicrobium sp.]|nr:hypothetical protein [Candidatus Deferrimicrobium sp.]
MPAPLHRCLAVSSGTLLAAAVLLAAGIPGPVVFALAPALLCVGLPLVIGLGDRDGRLLLETAQRAVRPPEK